MNLARRICAFAIALLAVSTSQADAKVRRSVGTYDGGWHLVFATRSGTCDPAYEFDVNVTNGIISHPNLLKFRGRVAADGRVRASVSVSDKFASGSGWFTSPTSGSGSWRGFSGTSRCGGIWTAQRG